MEISVIICESAFCVARWKLSADELIDFWFKLRSRALE